MNPNCLVLDFKLLVSRLNLRAQTRLLVSRRRQTPLRHPRLAAPRPSARVKSNAKTTKLPQLQQQQKIVCLARQQVTTCMHVRTLADREKMFTFSQGVFDHPHMHLSSNSFILCYVINYHFLYCVIFPYENAICILGNQICIKIINLQLLGGPSAHEFRCGENQEDWLCHRLHSRAGCCRQHRCKGGHSRAGTPWEQRCRAGSACCHNTAVGNLPPHAGTPQPLPAFTEIYQSQTGTACQIWQA